MNFKYIFLLLAIFTSTSNAQEDKAITTEMNSILQSLNQQTFTQYDAKNLDEITKKIFTWSVNENDKGYMMTLDYPYPMSQPIDYLSLTIIKPKSSNRPYLFSCAVSSIIDPKKGISIYFGSYDKVKRENLKISSNKIENIPFSDIYDEYIKIAFENMVVKTKKNEVDIFNEMLNYDYIFFVFYNKSGEKYSIGYPLLTFKEQYQTLK